MFRKHVSGFISAYCHEELSPEESRQVAEHLIGCSRCRVEFEEIKLGVKLTKQLPIVSAPESIWTGIEAVLGQRAKTVAPKVRRSFLKPTLAIAASLLLLLVGAVLMFRLRHNESGRPLWEVARLNGTPRIGSTRIADKATLSIVQCLDTDDSQR